MDRAGAARWIASYEALWREARAQDLGDLFTDDAVYRTDPTAEPLRGIGAIRRWWATESDPAERWEQRAEVLAVDGDVAVARLEVRFTAPEARSYTDLWVMRFAPDGRCRAFEEWFWTGA